MPSLNRPNAPDRLPSSDFGNLFSRPRALRTSDPLSPSSTVSPLSFPPNIIGAQPRKRRTIRSSELGSPNSNLPLVSPGIATAQRRPNLVDRDSGKPGTGNHSGECRKLASTPGDPSNLEDGSTLMRHQSSSATSSKGIQILEISDAVRAPECHNDEEPPQARSDPQWKRNFLGGRLGIRFGREIGQTEEPSEGVTPSSLSYITTLGIPSTASLTRVQTSNDHRWADPGSNQLLLEESPEESKSTVSAPKEGLYCRTKRALGLKRELTNPTDGVYRSKDATATVLDRVSSNLREIAAKRLLSSSAKTSVSDLSIAAPRRHRFRPSSIYSTTSSIHERMMGTPPISTPNSEAVYTESDSHQHLAVGLGDDDNPSFLPSEARRVTTPPLRDSSPGKGKHRGFFFDYQAPQVQNFASRDPSRSLSTGRVGSISDTEWYRRKLDTIDTECNSPEEFVASVPEHLPNSPLCPRHPKHRSRGQGVCPYHGKNMTPPPESRSATLRGDSFMVWDSRYPQQSDAEAME